jgi:beta-mannosidase
VPIDPAVARPGDRGRELVRASFHHGAAHWFFAPDKELSYPQPAFDAEWVDGKLTIRAKTLMRDVCVFVDRLDPDATVGEQLVTLLPRESFTFEIGSERPLTKEQLTSPPVFRCVNPFGAARSGGA